MVILAFMVSLIPTLYLYLSERILYREFLIFVGISVLSGVLYRLAC